MDVGLIQKAKEEAEAELLQINTELTPYTLLVQRRAALVQYVQMATAILTQAQATHSTPTIANPGEASAPTPSQDEIPLWEAIRAVLREVGHSMRVPEIAAELTRSGRELSANWANESIRVAMSRKPDVFRRTVGKKWALKG